jgi:hypothetical protein
LSDAENARALEIALRLLEVELAIAGAAVDWIIEDSLWAPWNFDRGHRA